MIAFDPWVDVKTQAPPYDELVLVRGTKKVLAQWVDGWTNEKHEEEHTLTLYALAFNECYPPRMNMTQVVEHDGQASLKEAYPSIVFEVTHWMRIPE